MDVLCSCVRTHSPQDCRLLKLEKLVQELQTKIVNGHSKCCGDSTHSTISSGSIGSTDRSSTKATKRRRRREKLMAAKRLVAAGLMPEGTTSRDLPIGFGTKSPSASVRKFCALGVDSQQETDQKSLVDLAPRTRSGSLPLLPGVSDRKTSDEGGLDGLKGRLGVLCGPLSQSWMPSSHQVPGPCVTHIQKSLIDEWCSWAEPWNDYDSVYDLRPLFREKQWVKRPSVVSTVSLGSFFRAKKRQAPLPPKNCESGTQTYDRPPPKICVSNETQTSSTDSDLSILDYDSEEEIRARMYESWEQSEDVREDDEVTQKAAKISWTDRVRSMIDKIFGSKQMDLAQALSNVEALDKGKLRVVSEADRGSRWSVEKNEDGDVLCTLEPIPAENNNMPDKSNLGLPFGKDEARPCKVLVLSCFMKKRGLPFVDVGLYYHLKNANLNSGTVVSTHLKLSAKADKYLNQFRISHYDPQLMLEVKLWTVLAAMLPLKSERNALKILGNKAVFRAINDVAAFKRVGKISERRAWGLLPDRQHSLHFD